MHNKWTKNKLHGPYKGFLPDKKSNKFRCKWIQWPWEQKHVVGRKVTRPIHECVMSRPKSQGPYEGFCQAKMSFEGSCSTKMCYKVLP